MNSLRRHMCWQSNNNSEFKKKKSYVTKTKQCRKKVCPFLLLQGPCLLIDLPSSQSYVFFSSSQVWMWKFDYKESWALKNLCFCTVVLEKILKNPLDRKGIQPVHPKGNQSWIFIGRTDAEAETLILGPPAAKNWLIWKDPDAGKDWRWEEKGMTEDEMVRWHHQLNGHEFA